MYEYTVQPDGTREATRITRGYLRLLGDWIRGDVQGPYGRGKRLDGGTPESVPNPPPLHKESP